MKRDMELVRLILLKIEEEYRSTAIYNLNISGYDMETVAYHCKILNEAGLISDYGAQYADNSLWSFGVGSLTWEGNDFLDKIRDNSQWKKIKDTLQQDIEIQERQIENLEQFIQRVHKYKDLNELTPYALRELVKGVYIEAPHKSSGKRRQNIRVSYDLVGFIPLNELMKEETA